MFSLIWISRGTLGTSTQWIMYVSDSTTTTSNIWNLDTRWTWSSHTHTHTKNLYYSTELTLLNHINDCDLILKSLEGKSTFLPQNTLTFNPLTWLIKQTFTYTVGWHISCKDNYDIKCAAEKSALHRELLSFISNNEINNWPFPWVKVTWTRAQRIICNTH